MSSKIYLRMIIGSLLLTGGFASRQARGEAEARENPVYPVAIFPFSERGADLKGYGEKVSDILFATLVALPDLYLVDRAELKKTLEEQELNLSGIVQPAQATQVGQITGAKILVTGSVIEMDKTLYVVAKIIGTETSRVYGQSVKGNVKDELGPLVEDLGKKVALTITENGKNLVAKEVKLEDRIAALKEKLGAGKRPVLFVKIDERHVGQATLDPAAETEIALMGRETGFEVIDPEKGSSKKADVVIEGQGFSEFAMRRGNLVSVKARLEVKAIDNKTDQILAVDRQTEVVVDLTEQVAGKSALQNAAAAIAERLLPKLVEKK